MREIEIGEGKGEIERGEGEGDIEREGKVRER